MTEQLCRHDLPLHACATCTGAPRDLLQEAIEANTVACRSKRCASEIVWAITERGRKMPVDVAPSPEGTVELFVDRGGDLQCRVRRQSVLPGTELRTSHFATCAEADRYRGPKAGAR